MNPLEGGSHDGNQHVHEDYDLDESGKADEKPQDTPLSTLGVVLAFKVKFSHQDQVHGNQRLDEVEACEGLNPCELLPLLLLIVVGMAYSVERISWSVVVEDQEDIRKGTKDDEDQKHEVTNVCNSSSDQRNVISNRPIQSQPVKHLQPQDEHTKATKYSHVFNMKHFLLSRGGVYDN